MFVHCCVVNHRCLWLRKSFSINNRYCLDLIILVSAFSLDNTSLRSRKYSDSHAGSEVLVGSGIGQLPSALAPLFELACLLYFLSQASVSADIHVIVHLSLDPGTSKLFKLGEYGSCN